jgi:hypothetical protein
VKIGDVFLSNTGNTDANNHPPGETSGPNRYNIFTIGTDIAQSIAAASSTQDGFISFSLDCALPISNRPPTGCHQDVAWTTLKLNGVVIYDGCPSNNFLTINPCTGETR